MRKPIACLSLVLLFVTIPASVRAGTRILWPNQFTVVTSDGLSPLANEYGAARRNFYYLGAIAGRTALYECEVKLPAGARITQFGINARSFDTQPIAAHLRRIKMGGTPEYVATFGLFGNNPQGWYSAPSILLPTVAAGYKYWVEVEVENGNAAAYGARVVYR